ncbi:hypothetical protein CVD28_01925 [Bacillus sp. M6-12]|uniref:anthrax toxin lethal factor-related metalloendopeptidase n=1 Tax=Bacillus sp. M6-12 TaxID=2054166 RepID=UPI000C779BD1|nr:hypothetical protein [Bacillus sp. M6-12]PLS19190.1 hypothetical protein CVD28_01925 [Bacillus sp. M6-12]
MEWILVIGLFVAFLMTTNVGTWIRFTLHYAVKFKKLEGIDVVNMDGSKARFIMLLGSLTLLPDNVLELMKEKKVLILYSKSREGFIEGNYSGLFNGEENYIFVWDDGLRGNWGWQVTTLIHEVGHFVDYFVGGRNRFLSCIDVSLHNIYDGEHKYYERYANGTYYTSNIREYFAQSFAEYFLVTGFKQQCPDTASYIETVLNKIS